MASNFLTKIEREYGDNIFSRDESKDDVAVISTGSLSLDVSTGIGGIPKGRITTIYGAESSSKTSLCLEITKSALKCGERVLYIDLEQTLDHKYMRSIIGDFDEAKVLLAQPESAEIGLKIAEATIKGSPKLKIEPGEFGVIIVDSVGAFISEKELEKNLEESTYSATAHLLTKFCKRNAHAIRTNNIAFIFVNQVRDNIGSFFGGYSLPGGHALKHYSSLTILMSKLSKLKQGEDVIGINVKFIIQKNKLAPPFRSWDKLPLIFGKGYDYYRDVIEFSKMLGVLKMRGSFYNFEDENLGQGMNKAIDYLKENKDVLDKIVSLCYSAVGIGT